jgi:hypothetical protein
MAITSETIIEKQPSEKLFVGVDFNPWLTGSSTISNPTIVYTSGELSISNITIDGDIVEFFIASGIAGKNYRIEVTVDVSNGEILTADGILQVRDQ